MFGQDKDANGNMMFTPVSTAGSTYVYRGGSIPVNAVTLLNADLPTDPLMPYLEDTRIFSGAYDDKVEGAEADFNNLELTTVRRTNYKDYQNCLLACFLSQIEPKKMIQALADPSWIEAMQDELLQFKLQKVIFGLCIIYEVHYIPDGCKECLSVRHNRRRDSEDIQCAGSDHDHYQEAACAHHEEHVMHDCVQLDHVVDSHDDYTSDSNIILCDQYVKDNEVPVIHSDLSYVPDDAFLMIYDDMCKPRGQPVSYPSRNTVVKNSLTAELATYKEHVELYEQRAKFELTEREQKINEQLRIVISDRNFKEETLKRELHSIKLQLASTINHNKPMVEDKLIKQDQSLQMVHMLCRPRPNPNALNRVAIGYKNPLCLTRAKQVQPALYNGHEIIKDNHILAIVHNSEDTLEIAEITMKKINDKMNDPECVTRKVKIAPHDYSKENLLATFTPQKQLTPEQIFWSNDLMKLKSEALIEQTKAQNDLFRAKNDKIKQHYKELYDSIKITRAKHIEQVTKLTTKNVNLKTCVSKPTVNPQVSARDKHAIDIKQIVPRLRNNRDAHLDYLRHLKESVETIRDIVEEPKVVRPRDRSIISACRYTKHSQELLEYAIGTCPQGSQQQAKQLAHIPLIRKKQVTVAKPSDKSDRVNSCPNASGSQPKSHHYKELYDSIKITRAKHIKQVTNLTNENVNLKTCVSKATVNPQVSAQDKHAIDVEPIVPRLRNNRDAHLDYLRHLKESVETIRDILEEAKVVRPLDRSIVSACRYTKHSQELLEYAIGTCPQGSQPRAKQLVHIPFIRKKQVTVAQPSNKLDSTTHRHVVTIKSQKTNIPVPPSTGVNCCSNASRSQPKSHVKLNRISPAKGDNKLPVDD
nr:ribonuclease H-like domain, reverse transcriptase, RNA-dependent DNA polymerase [Tanacetum cinerariifolium]